MRAHVSDLCRLSGVRGAARAESRCSYQDLLDHLNLSRSNELFSLTRPVRDHRQPTVVSVELLLYAILDVVSADTFLPCLRALWDVCGSPKRSVLLSTSAD